MRKIVNREHIEGILFQHDLELKVTGETSKNPGTQYIAGNIEIAVDEEGLNVIPVAAVNGEMGGTMSEEFMFISDAGEDTILVNKEETIGLNTEVLEMENSKDYLFNNYGISDLSGFEIRHCIELGHIFQLGQKYSLSMNGFFADANGNSSPYYMGCYGIGISRALAAICEQNCDENGLIWTKKIAPYKVSIIYQNSLKDEAFDLYSKLNTLGIDVLIDDRNASFGSKIKNSKLIGIPYMVIIGKSFQMIIYMR